MNIRKKILIGFLFGLASHLATAQQTLDFMGVVDDSQHPAGYREYVEMGCWQCHGFQGQGGLNLKLVAPLIPYEAFANQVRRPRNVMPAYSPNIMSEDVLQEIYSYLQNIPTSPNPDDIPLLSGD